MLIATAPLFAIASAGRAQETNGMIDGVVRDTLGSSVPGALVQATNGMGLSVESVTDSEGVYRFPALFPASYELTAQLAGFVTARVPDVILVAGGQLHVPLVLEPAGIDVRIEVVGRSSSVEIARATSATSLRSDQIERMPRGRDFTSLISPSPGVNVEPWLGGLSIDGSSGAENRVMVDGIETTDTLSGVPGLPVLNDLIEEIQVKSSGYTAEFGGSTGGVVNIVTRSGGDTFRARAFTYYSHHTLDAGPRPVLRLVPTDTSRSEHVVFPEDSYSDTTIGLMGGGPLVRSRLWFFATYAPSLRSTNRTTTFRADGSTRTFHQDVSRQDLAVSLTAHSGSRWRGRSTFTMGSQGRRGILPALDGTGNPDADYSIDELDPNHSSSTTVDVIAGARFLVSGRAGFSFRDTCNEGVYQGDRINYQGSSLGMSNVPIEHQRPHGYANVPSNFGRQRGKRPHGSAQISATAFLSALAAHQLKSGIQLDRVGLDTLTGTTGNGINVFWDQSFMGMRGPSGYYRIQSNDRLPNLGAIIEGKTSVNNVGVFIQDAWSVTSGLTLQLGVRTETERVPSLSPDPRFPDVAIRFGFADKLAPRIGLAWDASGDGLTKIFGSWGVFYDITKLQLALGFGAVSSLSYAYTLDGRDIDAIVDNPACPPACPGTLIQAFGTSGRPLNDPDDNRIDPELRQTRLHEVVVGIEREIARATSVTARYLRKQIDRVVEDAGTQLPGLSETVVMIANPGFGIASAFYPGGGPVPMALPRARRRYQALELSIERRLSGKWSGHAGYAWSRLSGNYSGLVHSDEGGRLAPNVGRIFDSPLTLFDESGQPVYGPLATDRPHRVKAGGVVELRRGLSVGAEWLATSGIPRTRQAAFMPRSEVTVMYRGRASDGRMGWLTQLDGHVTHRLSLGGSRRLEFSVTALNVLNRSAAIDYFPSELFLGQAISVDERAFYAGIDTQALIAQQALVRDPRFLRDAAFQSPRTVRVGVSFDF